MIRIGQVLGWSGDSVTIAIQDKQNIPSLGDLLYTIESTARGYRILLMEVTGFTGEAPISSVHVDMRSNMVQLDVVMTVNARLFIEILKQDNGVILQRASRPPLIASSVYIVRKNDPESEEIMKHISEYSYTKRGADRRGLGIVVLRAGSAHNEMIAKEKYFFNAQFSIDLPDMLRKHVLVVGQTGSGKTSGIQGILLKYALESTERIGWLIIDRHGEYVPPEGYVENRFVGYLVDAVRSNPYLSHETRIVVYKLVKNKADTPNVATVPGVLDLIYEPISANSISFQDFLGLGHVDSDKATMLEEFIQVIMDLLKKCQTESQGTKLTARKAVDPQSIAKIFYERDDPEYVNGNMLALIPLIVDNFVRYEGVGKSISEKRGIHKILVERGIDAKSTRALRRLVLSIMGWRVRTHVIGERQAVVTIDDSNSVVKVSGLLKDPKSLSCFFEALLTVIENHSNKYPWTGICKEDDTIELKNPSGVDVSEVVRLVDNGNIVVFDVSQLDAVQGDLAVLTLVRRLFQSRLEAGVEASKLKPVISIISEEAPLYLGPDHVKSPYNPFARIAREGRKFGVGLVAITQMASLIERQILGNFNTVITMRTKSSSDLNLMRDIGIPVDSLPFLGDRECFIYTPDLPIKEPIPVYIPAWFDEIYTVKIKELRSRMHSQDIKVPRSLIETAD